MFYFLESLVLIILIIMSIATLISSIALTFLNSKSYHFSFSLSFILLHLWLLYPTQTICYVERKMYISISHIYKYLLNSFLFLLVKCFIAFLTHGRFPFCKIQMAVLTTFTTSDCIHSSPPGCPISS